MDQLILDTKHDRPVHVPGVEVGFSVSGKSPETVILEADMHRASPWILPAIRVEREYRAEAEDRSLVPGVRKGLFVRADGRYMPALLRTVREARLNLRPASLAETIECCAQRRVEPMASMIFCSAPFRHAPPQFHPGAPAPEDVYAYVRNDGTRPFLGMWRASMSLPATARVLFVVR